MLFSNILTDACINKGVSNGSIRRIESKSLEKFCKCCKKWLPFDTLNFRKKTYDYNHYSHIGSSHHCIFCLAIQDKKTKDSASLEKNTNWNFDWNYYTSLSKSKTYQVTDKQLKMGFSKDIFRYQLKDELEKKCSCCNEWWPYTSDFFKTQKRKDGRTTVISNCNACELEKKALYRKKNGIQQKLTKLNIDILKENKITIFADKIFDLIAC